MKLNSIFSHCVVFLLMASAVAQAAPAPALAQTHTRPATFAHRALVKTQDAALLKTLIQKGGVLLEDYGAFSLWDVAALGDAAVLKNSAVELRDDYNTLALRETRLNTLAGAAADSAIPNNLKETQTGPRFNLIQFYGPIKDEWLDALRKTDVEIVSYMAENAFVVYGDDAALARMSEWAQTHRAVQWVGAYHPFYRLTWALRQTAQDQKQLVDVTVQVYRTREADTTMDMLAALAKAAGGAVIKQPQDVLVYRNMTVQLPASALAQVAAWPTVFAVQDWHAPQKMDESQGQILAGTVISSSGKVAPVSPGYLAFLEAKDFPTNPSAYPIVDVVDDGVDIGVPANVLHPDFRVLGQASNPSRIAYANNCTTDPAADGVAGHGNLNAGIVAGYNNSAGFPFADAYGYHLGLGISPYGRVANTKIFANSGNYSVSECGNTDQGVVLKSYTAGANLTSNSWGANAAGAYDDSAQAYDALTRDANSITADGNQQMLHIFSAGNAGKNGAKSIGSPATAKNVLSVGATENVRDEGVTDGCNELNADNADDIAGFSSRGPTVDLRVKPDIMAPGTHVQGPASQATGFDGTGVCAVLSSSYYPAGQTLYTWSSGTSHSAPAVSGAASLLWEYYGRALKPGVTPSPAMLKALMLNAPRYLQGLNSGDTLPSNAQGWGDVNLGSLFDGIPRFLVDQTEMLNATGQQYQASGKVGQSDKPFRVTLVWTDAPGPLSGNSYVNNLDLEVTVGGQTYKGNVMSGAFSAPGGTADARNNVESVFIPAGASGNFSVKVIATNIAGDGVPANADTTDQDFALVIYNVESAVITGQVRAAAGGASIPNARVQAAQSVTNTTETRTDANGAYKLFVAPGMYTMTASAYGFLPQTMPGVNASVNSTSTVAFVLNAAPFYAVSGVITSAVTGLPVMATVTAYDAQNQPISPTASTNPSTGAYSLALAGGAAYTLRVMAPLHTEASRAIGVLAGDQTQNFGLVPLTTNGGVMGNARSSLTGLPIAGAVVAASGLTNTAQTNANGDYVLTGLAPGAYTITASAVNYTTGAAQVTVPQSNFAHADFALGSGRAVVAPLILAKTLEYGQVATDTLAVTITNTGNAPMKWQASEGIVQRASATSAGRVLVVTGEQSYTSAALQAMSEALAALGYTYDVSASQVFSGTPLLTLLSYDAVVYLGDTKGGNDPLIRYLDAGGHLLIADNDLGYWEKTTAFYNEYLQATFLSDNACGLAQNCELTGDDILADIAPSIAADPYPDAISLRTKATPILKYANGAPAGAKIERMNYRAIYFPFDFEFLSDSEARNLVVSRVLDWMGGRLDLLPWISIEPTSGTLAPGANQTVQAKWDASLSGVDGPGVYTGRVRLSVSDPMTPNVDILTTLNVLPSANQAMIYGTVSEIGNCGAMTSPLASAQITLFSASGGVAFSFITRADGQFGHYVTNGTYTVTAVAAGHESATQVIVAAAGQNVDASLNLRRVEPCLSASRAQIFATGGVSQAVSVSVTLSSVGSAPVSVVAREATSTNTSRNYIFAKTGDANAPPFLWLDPAGGQLLNVADDGALNVAMPFPFVFYSQTVTQLRVNNNGAILLNNTSGAVNWSNGAMTSAPDYFVAPFWDDLSANAGRVYLNVMGSEPHRKAVVSWVDRPHFASSGEGIGNVSFQAVFYEGGSIGFNYLDTDFGDPSFNEGASATIGIRGAGAASVVQVSYNTASIPSGSAVCFTPPGGVPCGGMDVAWISISPTSTQVLTGTATLSVTLNTAGDLPPGVYHAQIVLMSNSPMTPQLIPVDFLVSQTRLWLPVLKKQ